MITFCEFDMVLLFSQIDNYIITQSAEINILNKLLFSLLVTE